MALDVSCDIDGDNDDVVDNDDNDNNEFLDCLKALTLNLNMITVLLLHKSTFLPLHSFNGLRLFCGSHSSKNDNLL